MSTHTENSSHLKNEHNASAPSIADLKNFFVPKDIKNKIEKGSKSAIKEIKKKSAGIKENVTSYVQAHPLKCLVYVAISTFIFSKFI